MDNTTLKACITKMLSKKYTNCKIYKDKQGVNVKLPAFFVRYVNVSQIEKGMGFFEQSYLVEIRYMPDSKISVNDLNTHLDLTGGQVVDLLNVVRDDTSDFSVRATNLDYNIEDGVLIILGNYTILRKRIVEKQDSYVKGLEQIQKVR